MNNLFQRTVTGITIVIVTLGAVILGAYSFLLLCLVINLLGLFEFYRLFQINQNRTRNILAVLLSAILLISTCLWIIDAIESRILLINLPLISVIFVAELYQKSDSPFANLAFVFLGIVYITLPLILFFHCGFGFGDNLYHPKIILGYLFLLWANDTGAFISGSLLGKHSLFQRISPKKTWEGSVGGAFLVMVLVVVNNRFLNEISLLGWVVIGVAVIVMGTFGDLVKSLMKRSLQVKDSGTILPGHGGILDRFDSLIGSVPFVYASLTFQL